jgi:hypothetical protein
MKASNYNIIDERALSQQEVVKGMDFEQVLKIKPVPNVPLKSWIFGSVVVISIVASVFFFVNSNKSELKNTSAPKTDSIIRTTEPALDPEPKEEVTVIEKKDKMKAKDTVLTTKGISIKDEENYDAYAASEAGLVKSVKFKTRFNVDAETAITIEDSIYGPTNVSIGRGDFCEYKDPGNELSEESNSAWFKFTIKRDTLLTFHIVPTLKTDNYDFALFKCDNYNCMRDFKLGKLKPVAFCFSWNTSQNANTGLSRKGKDTTFQMTNAYGSRTGRTYAGAIRVKAGETYYLMVNVSSVNLQDPEGFMIYFYNYLPKSKVNSYKQ